MTIWDQTSRPPWIVPAAVGAAGIVLVSGVVFWSSSAQAKMRSSTSKASPSSLPHLKGSENVARYLEEAERVSRIKGLAIFGLAASKRESGWNNMSANRSTKEAAAACKAWRYQKDRSLSTTPYREDKYWCWGTGGWYGQMPAYALARDPFKDLNPLWAVHDPATSTAMFTAARASLIQKFFPKLPPGHRNWLAVRRSMASLKAFYDYNEEGDTARGVRSRFAQNLQQIGVDPNFMFEKPSASEYPGNKVVWDALKKITIPAATT